MHIFGLDFSSNPSKSKRLTLAKCKPDEGRLTVCALEELNTANEGDYSKFDDWLAGNGGHEPHWVAGIDFPFGMPVAAVERFGWVRAGCPQNWESYIDALYDDAQGDLEAFRKQLESWRKPAKSGDDKRVFLLRHTDKLSSLAGSTPSSPMKVHHQCNPPVGRMFFQGARRLCRSGVCIYPVRPNRCPRIVVEAYPRLVADKFIPGDKYKDGTALAAKREAVLDGLSQPNEYGVLVSFADSDDRQACIDDDQGDKLDSVLCAVQAAWACRTGSRDATANSSGPSFGVPTFSVACMNQVVALEGWIVDPLLLRSVDPRSSAATPHG